MRFCHGCNDMVAGTEACISKPKSMAPALDMIRWCQHTRKAVIATQKPCKKAEDFPSEKPANPPVFHGVGLSKSSMDNCLSRIELYMEIIHLDVILMAQAVGRVRCKQKRMEDDTKALIEADIREGTFVTTTALADGLLLLKQNGVLLITGHAGTGKSRIGQNVLHRFSTDDTSYKCIKLNTLEEWEDSVSREDNVAVLIDDIFGETNCIYNREKYAPTLDKVHSYVCKGNIKVIITIRDTVKRHCQEVFDSHRLFQFKFIDLSSDNYKLDKEEKLCILKNYMKAVRQSDLAELKGFVDHSGIIILEQDEVSKITKENPVKGFPLAVYQFVHNNNYFQLGSTFFDRPTEAILDEINDIRRKGKYNEKLGIQYAVMVYTVINENCINPDDSSIVTEIENVIDAIYGQTPKMKKCNILDAVKELKGSYLANISNETSYRLHHPTLQESVILSFAQIDEKNLNKIIPLLSWPFFLKMIKPDTYKKKEGEVVLNIPTNSYNLLAYRLVDIFIEEIWKDTDVKNFLGKLCNTEIFQQEKFLLCILMLEALENEDNTDNFHRNMILSVDAERFYVNMKSKDVFLALLIVSVGKMNKHNEMYNFILQRVIQLLRTSNDYFTISNIKTALVTSLYEICATKDKISVKATLDLVYENKIPVLLDQGLVNCVHYVDEFSSDFGYSDTTIVFLTFCIWKAYEAFNEHVLIFLLSKYNEIPFDLNRFLKIVQRNAKYNKSSSLSHVPLRWMITRFVEQELDDFNSILESAFRLNMLDTVKYLFSICKMVDARSCLKTLLEEVSPTFWRRDLFDFLFSKIDCSSTDLSPIVISLLQRDYVPMYMFDKFLPVCLNDDKILSLSCKHGHFYLAKCIMDRNEKAAINSALISACMSTETKKLYNSNELNIEDNTLEIVKYIVYKFGFEKIDLKAACQQSYHAGKIDIIEWFIMNKDIQVCRLDMDIIIMSALKGENSKILKSILQKTEMSSLNVIQVLKSVTQYIKCLTARCSPLILELLSTVWDSTEDKEKLKIDEIVDIAYEKNCFELLMWIYKNCNPHISIDGRRILMLACHYGRIDVAQWVLQTFEQTSLDINAINLLMRTCQTDRINVVKLVLKHCKKAEIDISGTMQKIVYTAYEENCFELLMWMHENCNSDISIDGTKLLMLACQNCRIDTAMWVLHAFERISMDIDEGELFLLACDQICIDFFHGWEQRNIDMVNLVLKNFQINPFHLNAGLLKIITEYMYSIESTEDCIYSLVVSILEKGCISEEKLKIIMNKSLDRGHFALVNWLLKNRSFCSFDRQTILNTACANTMIKTIEILSTSFSTLDMNQAMTHLCFPDPEISFTSYYDIPDCLNLLMETSNDDSIDMNMIVGKVCKDNYVSHEVMESTEDCIYSLVVSILEKGCISEENIKIIMNKYLDCGHFALVNWLLKNRSFCSFDRQTILNTACANAMIETIEILSTSFSTLDMNQAMTHLCFPDPEISFTSNYDIPDCLNLLMEKSNDDSIDMNMIVGKVCKDNYVSHEVMTWILLNLPPNPDDEFPIKELLRTCCENLKIHHVKYLFNKVDFEQCHIKAAFSEICLQNSSDFKWIFEDSSLCIDFLFQKLQDKLSAVSEIQDKLLDKKNFDLILYFLNKGFCKTIDMNNLMNEACRYGDHKLVQWILENVEQRKLDIRSAFLEVRSIWSANCNHQYCVALIWHYTHAIDMLMIDTVLKTIYEAPVVHRSNKYLNIFPWLLYIKTINERKTCELKSTQSNSEKNRNQQKTENQKLETSATSLGYIAIGPKDGRTGGTDTSQLPDDFQKKRNSHILQFGLSSAGYVFTTVVRPLVKHWRKDGTKTAVDSDDSLALAEDEQVCAQQAIRVKEDLILTGFVSNKDKCILKPLQNLGWLVLIYMGFEALSFSDLAGIIKDEPQRVKI
ncbi:unnamed protein product [Mytilus coruscus]|uniref:Novel STAND NTPase 3 domain-containing protein n=1 Tax=Mytilus coruscus TaxID=42192 RepID=A0A6J8F007_MYTCO|nr:unnamed protein product [Mytilus coruscus]